MSFGHLGALGKGFGRLGAPLGGASHPPPAITGGRMLVIGDSFVNNESLAGTNSWTTYASGMCVMLEAISQGKFIFNAALQKGVSGETSAQTLARFSTDVTPNAASFDIGVVSTGRNDIGGTSSGPVITTQQAIDSTTGVCNGFLAIGKPVLLFLSHPPRNDSQLSANGTTKAAQRQMMIDVNTAMRAFAQGATNGVYLVDYETAWGGAGNPPTTNYTYDGLHPSRVGSYFAAKLANDTYGSLVPARTPPIYTAYNSSTNPFGNLVFNKSANAANLAGTTGQVFNATGSLATDWQFGRDSGGNTNGAIVLSKETVGDGTFRQVVTQTLDGDFNGQILSLTPNGTATPLPTELLGKQLAAEFTMEVVSNSGASINALLLFVNNNAISVTSTGLSNLDSQVANVWSLPVGTYLVRCPPVTVSAVDVSPVFWPQLRQLVLSGTSETVKFTKPWVGRVT